MTTPHIRTTGDLWAWASLLVLPVCAVAAMVAARAAGGPTWLWFNLDPDYFYLLDAVNLVNLTTPGHVVHPGTTVQWLGALILKAAYPLRDGAAIADAVLAEPERHLRLISNVFVAVNFVAAVGLGAAGWRAFAALTPAWMLQAAPLLSMLIVKHGHHVKPEALLVATTLALMAVAALTLDGALLQRRRARFAVAFGVIAGFGVATKVTALPVFVLPLLVLASRRAIVVYAAVAAAALVVFTLPMAGAYGVFFAWMARIGSGVGAYGGGAPGLVDWSAYPGDVVGLLVRPVLHVPLALALGTLAWAAWRRRGDRPLPAPEARLLAGVVAAQIAQVLVVAKQPNAMYLIPSLMLSALAVVALWRSWAAAASPRGRAVLGRGLVVLLAALVAAQGASVVRFTGELAGQRGRALLAADDSRFGACARVYAYAASSPAFALMLADYAAGERFSERLAARGRDDVYWLEHWWDQSRVVFRDWRGPADIAAALADAPCVVVRGTQWAITGPLLRKLAPGLTFDGRCRAGDETIVTRGVGCDGGPPAGVDGRVDRPGANR